MPLSPYLQPLTSAEARHLLRRLGIASPLATVLPLVGLLPQQAVARLLDEAEQTPVPSDSSWYLEGAEGSIEGEMLRVFRRMMGAGGHPVREKLALFWHNHFSINANTGGMSRTWAYLKLLHRRAFGDFRVLLHEIGLSPAMLHHLNGERSYRSAPNQNYARELMELFTMGLTDSSGKRNYTEEDVAEIARALTGWKPVDDEQSQLHRSGFDAGEKTIFGQTGPWGYDDVMRLLFEHRAEAIAQHLARKLISFYVTHVPSPEAVQALAAVLRNSGFNIRIALEALFTSRYFFEPGHQGSIVRGPIELYVGLMSMLGVNVEGFSFKFIRDMVNNHGQPYFYPPTVAGWAGHNPPSSSGRAGYAAWYPSDRLGHIWGGLSGIVNNEQGFMPWDPLSLLETSEASDDPCLVAQRVAEYLLAVPLEWASIPDLEVPFAGNPDFELPLSVLEAPAHLVSLTKILLGPVPYYEWRRLSDEARAARLRAYCTFLVCQLPEFLVH